MRILHTADWHLGRRLYDRDRQHEFNAFLSWLVETAREQQIDVLLLSGDVFDTTTPSHAAQAGYYGFLDRVVAAGVRHVVVTGGNHDSPSLLNAPRALLQSRGVQVVGSATPDPADEVLVLRNGQGEPELIVCAVPYLREADVRRSVYGEGASEQTDAYLNGIRAHYDAVAVVAEERRLQLAGEFPGRELPIVAMGHLFASGGLLQKVEDVQVGEGVRNLRVGSLFNVPAQAFSESFDYVALGHLHVPQMVGGQERIRYSGSPLPMGFGEARQQKSVCVVEFQGLAPRVELVDIPRFQALEQVSGDREEIFARLEELVAAGDNVWLEIDFRGSEDSTILRNEIEAAVEGSRLQVLRVRNDAVVAALMAGEGQGQKLSDLDVDEVFERLLDSHNLEEEARVELRATYHEAVRLMEEQDVNAGEAGGEA